MNKRIKGIIALFAGIIVLSGSLIILLNIKPEQGKSGNSQTSATEPQNETVELNRRDPSTVNKVEVSNEEGSFTVLRTSLPQTDGEREQYTIEGYEDLRLENSLLSTLPYNGSDLFSVATVGTRGDGIEKFGLEPPRATVVLHYDSGDAVKFFIGDNSPTATASYFMLDGDDNVYTVAISSVSNFHTRVRDFVSKIIVERPSEENFPIVERVRITRDDLDNDIVIKYDRNEANEELVSGGTAAAHVLTEPFRANLNITYSQNVTHGIFGLNASDFYSIKPTAGDIAEAGLSEPFCTVVTECDNGVTYTFLMSEPFIDESGSKSHYAMLEGGNVIYIVSAENAVWGTISIIDFTSYLVYSSMVWDIRTMTVTGRDFDTVIFEGEGTDKTNYVLTKNGEAFDNERFRLFYSFLLSTAAEDVAYDKPIPNGKPLVRIEIKDAKLDRGAQYIEYYEDTLFTCLFVINGETKYTCSKSYVDTLIGNIRRIHTGEAYVTKWS